MDIGGEDKMKKIRIEKQIVFIFLLFTAFFTPPIVKLN